VGIGSDEAAYTGVNPISDMKSAHLNSNVDAFHNNVPNVPMSIILRMHTIEAAKALGMGNQIGSLEPNKKADMIILNPNTVNMTPVLVHPLTNVPQNIVSSATGTEIETVIIDGRIVMEDHVVKTADEAEIIAQAQTLAQQSAEDAAAYFGRLPFSEVLERQRWFEQK
jgi:5-methylthioadenosine/S-adenosylhomocysteine deaminase